jgi:ABC-type uncharacterized transport system substrate-binding protein
MINLEEHIVEIEGVKYVTLEIAQAAILNLLSENKLDEAVNGIQEAIRDMDNSLKNALNDD